MYSFKTEKPPNPSNRHNNITFNVIVFGANGWLLAELKQTLPPAEPLPQAEGLARATKKQDSHANPENRRGSRPDTSETQLGSTRTDNAFKLADTPVGFPNEKPSGASVNTARPEEGEEDSHKTRGELASKKAPEATGLDGNGPSAKPEARGKHWPRECYGRAFIAVAACPTLFCIVLGLSEDVFDSDRFMPLFLAHAHLKFNLSISQRDNFSHSSSVSTPASFLRFSFERVFACSVKKHNFQMYLALVAISPLTKKARDVQATGAPTSKHNPAVAPLAATLRENGGTFCRCLSRA
ncbi:hypothetical protein, conserved in T. vivax [Trypanosoma vivax Y486]|uniref:Uncharacterized protein n=1 Tax=Trypanosoma vivax (strain Y486) TaxID=1055687 RepID=F9WU91_TRYVY|nr:hypothetical protein, conserved in T. vivax [Trypanosoma vivax Y486]|eukprot:CCD21139.1 hypothetical protein, conserved in T. vivax [Trypanosoma vivax Y486]